MLTHSTSAAIVGIHAQCVEIEVNVTPSAEPRIRIVGLPDTAVKESIDRVQTALRNACYKLKPASITINLAPADLKKEGPIYDLPIALALLSASDTQALPNLSQIPSLGELALSSQVRKVRGILPATLALKAAGYRALIVPYDNADEAALVDGIDIYPVRTIREAAEIAQGHLPAPYTVDREALLAHQPGGEDFSDIKGQQSARRAIEVAVSGGHNLLMSGSPGAGKTMLARRIPTILPPLTLDEALEVTAIQSVAGTLQGAFAAQRPFRAPHHTISDAGLIGGGKSPMPGEVSLAHRGVLFLDEMPEFHRNVLEVLRQPLEEGHVTISRAATSVTYPADFMLVAAMNPCPCGFAGDPKHECRCTETQIRRYRDKLSGPLLDRIDLHIDVPAVPFEALTARGQGESSAAIRERVLRVRAIQAERYKAHPGIRTNADLPSKLLPIFCALDATTEALLKHAMDELHLTARAYTRILRVARTIADMAGAPDIQQPHLYEAICYRTLERW